MLSYSYLPHRQFRKRNENDELYAIGYLPHRQFRKN